MTKKILLSLCLIALLGPLAWADPISPKMAQQLASQFWMQHSPTKTTPEFIELASPYTYLHLLNADDGNGFVIVAANDRATTILGYCNRGSLNMDSLPPALRYWLGCYDNQVQTTCQYDFQPAKNSAKDSVGDSVPALVPVTWDQGKYYNDKCPTDNSLHGSDLNHHPYTGCTATAMAQVMKYWNWPPHGIGSYSYTWENEPYYHWSYGTLSADFENTIYQWDSMPAKLTSQSSEGEIDAVSTLIYHCGVATQMAYNDDHQGGSGAFVTLEDMGDYGEYCAENALPEFFAYKTDVRGLLRDNYTDEEWIEMLKEELRAGRPLIYQGYTGTDYYAYGHCFVLDGFNADDQFHVNWGWSGDYDGYYAITALRPYGQYTYSYYQEGLFYLEPDYARFDNSDTTGTGDTDTVGIARIPSKNTAAWVANGNIIVFGAEGQMVEIADMMGRIFFRRHCDTDRMNIAVPTTGIYLIRIGRETHKVSVLQ